MTRTSICSVVMVGALTCFVPFASADVTSQCTGAFTSGLTVADSGSPAGPYGTVCVNLNSSTEATITFTSEGTYEFGDSHIVAVEINASTFTEAFSSESFGGSSVSNFKDFGSGEVDGFGSFNLFADDKDFSPSDSVDTFVFTVTNTSSTWANAGDVLKMNASNFDAAAHIRPGSNGTTFFVGEGTGQVVPEPRFDWTVVAGLLLVVGVAVWRRRAQDQI
jgi:hypothetical protein